MSRNNNNNVSNVMYMYRSLRNVAAAFFRSDGVIVVMS